MAGRRRTDRGLAERGPGGARPSRDGGLDLRAGDAAVSGGDTQRRDGHPLLSAQRLLELCARGPASAIAARSGICATPGTPMPAGGSARSSTRRSPDIVHTHLIDGFSAAIWRRARRAGVPIVHTAHDYHLLCPRAFLLTARLADLPAPERGLPALSRLAFAHRDAMSICSSVRRASAGQHRAAGLRGAPDRGRAQRHPAAADAADIRRQSARIAELPAADAGSPSRRACAWCCRRSGVCRAHSISAGDRRARSARGRGAAGRGRRSAHSLCRLCHRRGEAGIACVVRIIC